MMIAITDKPRGQGIARYQADPLTDVSHFRS